MKYLGVDWGLKKIGLAYSEGKLASPLTSVSATTLASGTKQIQELVKKEKIDLVVMGQPEGKMGKIVDKVAKTLQKLGLTVVLTDETLSTQEAKQRMIEMGLGQKARREDNSVAATIILQRYLDDHA
ncbi:Holliday junction resolvase RuvX [Candidatus Daviesbacteria bacterium]|nr:Holliday junction resolvase RuvX [Candidatus Daviesbacteria bacterium]